MNNITRRLRISVPRNFKVRLTKFSVATIHEDYSGLWEKLYELEYKETKEMSTFIHKLEEYMSTSSGGARRLVSEKDFVLSSVDTGVFSSTYYLLLESCRRTCITQFLISYLS